jgi:cytochrome c oxidase subunit 3
LCGAGPTSTRRRQCRRMREARPVMPYSTLAQQHEAAELGIWTFLATEVLFFGGLILAYCVYRYGYPAEFAEAGRHTRIGIGTANTAILLTSSLLVAWAVSVAKTDAGTLAARLLVGAAVLGVLFLGLKAYEYLQEYREHLVPGLNFASGPLAARGSELFFVFYFTATGLHAIHLAIGIVVLLVIAWRARQGAYSARFHSPITVASLYWHFVDAVWIFLFALIYLLGRSGP